MLKKIKQKNMAKKETISITVRFDKEVYAKICKKSAKDNRSRNYIINEHSKSIKC